MLLSDAGRNSLLHGGFVDTFPYLSLHTAWPSTTGANEATGGSPAYARKAHGLAIPTVGVSANASTITFDAPGAPTTYFWEGFWTAATSGTFGGAIPCGGQEIKRAAFTIATPTNTFTATGHGMSNNDTVYLFDVENAGLPSGFTEGTVYYVINKATDTFQLAATAGGSAVAGGSSTDVIFHQIVPIVATTQGTIGISAAQLNLKATLL